MTTFEDAEIDRPQFKGDKVMSHINGKPTKYFPDSRRSILVAFSNVVVGGLILFVIGCVSVIFYANYYIVNNINDDGAKSSGTTATSLANAIQIQVLNYFYYKIAIWVTERENHR